jgi:dolichol kinase
LGDGTAGLFGERYGRSKLPWNSSKSWVGFISFVIFSVLATRYQNCNRTKEQFIHRIVSQVELV